MSQVLNIQSGTTPLPVGSVPKAVTVAPYIATQTILYFSQRGAGGINSRSYRISAVKTDSTTITFDREVDADDGLVVDWFLVEHDSSVDVQDFSRTGDGNVIISALDLTTSWIIPTWTHGGSNLNNDDFGRWFFNIPTLPGVLNGVTDTTIQWDCQAIDYPDCDLQHFVLFSPTPWITLFFTKIIDPAVDLTKSYIQGTSSRTTSGTGAQNDMHRLDISGTFLFRMRRGSSLTANVLWNINVIEFNDNTTVQELDQVTTTDQSVIVAAITPVDLRKASAHWGAVGPWNSMMKCGNQDRNLDKCSWSLRFLGNDNIRAERKTPVGVNDVSWMILEWDFKEILDADAAFYSFQGNEAPLCQAAGGFTRYRNVTA